VTIPAWIAIGVVVFGLVLLVVVLLRLRGRIGPFKAATSRLQEQADQVEELQKRLEQLQPRIDEVASKVEHTKAKLPSR
jgi:peptidoglycan hydrolase CwlO-like protein